MVPDGDQSIRAADNKRTYTALLDLWRACGTFQSDIDLNWPGERHLLAAVPPGDTRK